MAIYFRLFNLLCFVLQILVNSGWFNLAKNPTISNILTNSKHSILVPNPAAFGLWGLIYLLLLLFIVYQLFPFTYNLNYINKAISPYFPIQCLCNSGWVLVTNFTSSEDYAQYKPIRLIFIYGLLTSLYLSYTSTTTILKLDIIQRTNSSHHLYLNFWFGKVWQSIYFTWILFASIMDTFSCFNVAPNHISYLFASLCIYVLGGIIVYLVHHQSDVAAGLSLSWILAFLAIKNSPYQPNYSHHPPQFQLYIASILVMVAVLLTSFASLYSNVRFCIARSRSGYHDVEYSSNEAERILPVSS
ncbi:hypothetical protein K502DRAFT_346594 [Neoconidiobolus thromboides FSU 785]|nr:hypothetical protein K502DRAFT_346594 [Neoconidiobolus thromboides FSU 785]